MAECHKQICHIIVKKVKSFKGRSSYSSEIHNRFYLEHGHFTMVRLIKKGIKKRSMQKSMQKSKMPAKKSFPGCVVSFY